jgi:hypothetical protein
VEEALAARSFPRKHVVAHHDETLRREEQEYGCQYCLLTLLA